MFPDVQIGCIFFDGLVPSAEADEYVQITNHGQAAKDLKGWVLYDKADGSPSFLFPSYVLGSGVTIIVYTDEVEGYADWGSFTFRRKTAIWNNSDPDLAALKNAGGEEISNKGYPPGC